ncbi:serine carboxypeptidase-like 31 isoform X2 [Cucurbita moschata]|uniref:Carboxypeptidase n=1 Tax=Cucurbita moschata TaxID=3662 RepID=A0A6J1GRF0_CUCMO|nr:serine carboxypeptidase-like 31 isoform X2 [Cucurbita moschata]
MKVAIMGTVFVVCALLVPPALGLAKTQWPLHTDHSRQDDLVTNLPGQPLVGFRHFAGYVTVHQSHGRALFYWFYEAASHPDQKPLVLWLNGGPGCSSVGYGATQEIGPFIVDNDANGLKLNDYSWNKEANMLFLESPIGVGFSYTNTTTDYYNLGDEFTANDAYTFLQNWFLKFPSYKNHTFYIAGESYAGMVDYAWSHAVISDETHKIIRESCDFNSNDTWSNNTCSDAVDELLSQYKEIDIYSLYTSLCMANSASADGNSMQTLMIKHSNTMMPRMMGGYDPCLDGYAKTFYNRPDVQKALHVSDGHQLKNWSICNTTMFENWSDSKPSMIPIYKKLIAAGLRVWIYSGDTDGRVPVLSTRYSLSSLGLPITKTWRPWYHEKQVSGWYQEYAGLTFATFRGAGHAVPCFKPSSSLAFFASFLNGQSLPSSK